MYLKNDEVKRNQFLAHIVVRIIRRINVKNKQYVLCKNNALFKKCLMKSQVIELPVLGL